MAKKLYVGGIPYESTEEELQNLFSPMGEIVSVKIITDQYSGKSKGFGFVEMATDDEAQAAIEKLNGSDFNGRQITVNEARPPKPRGDRGGRGGGGGHRGGGGGGGGRRW